MRPGARSWKAKQYVVQVRPSDDGLVLQQLLYAEEVRSIKELGVELVNVSTPELTLAIQLIDEISKDRYESAEFKDEERARVLAAFDEKIAGKHIVEAAPFEAAAGGQVIDLMDALRASLGGARPTKAAHKPGKTAEVIPAEVLANRKPARRTAKTVEAEVDGPAVLAAPPIRSRARK